MLPPCYAVEDLGPNPGVEFQAQAQLEAPTVEAATHNIRTSRISKSSWVQRSADVLTRIAMKSQTETIKSGPKILLVTIKGLGCPAIPPIRQESGDITPTSGS